MLDDEKTASHVVNSMAEGFLEVGVKNLKPSIDVVTSQGARVVDVSSGYLEKVATLNFALPSYIML